MQMTSYLRAQAGKVVCTVNCTGVFCGELGSLLTLRTCFVTILWFCGSGSVELGKHVIVDLEWLVNSTGDQASV